MVVWNMMLMMNEKTTTVMGFAPAAVISRRSVSSFSTGSTSSRMAIPTDLPDSLEDAAEIAALSTKDFAAVSGLNGRCRVDFDTSVGDETYTTLKASTEFMQKYVSALIYAMVPGALERTQDRIMTLSQTRIELQTALAEEESEEESDRVNELKQILASHGASTLKEWEGPKIRVYFPDEGSAALARRDWTLEFIPTFCLEFSSCGGIQWQDISKDIVHLYFCPKASESEFVEEALNTAEVKLADQLKLSIFVNPNLVDMGVTGFGMAGRMLRERLIDNLVPIYYLRTLPWGALTRLYPNQFTVWQEDTDNEETGYRMIKSMDRLPSNPEVEDIYDFENGNADDPSQQKGFGLLDAIGDFVLGMTRL
eukprot:CAMPEP_0197825392 /NCGR_PEP_ID=MMETSP1437-20131217/2485_1 /TAXON_ID=49252 ORGANISM="Eucampia antarctica, Strain CCMP1452" /NCGR_SAMPLE_ID=MMETSP1437 /ASSEMBLY_ACC=CAM_ASM_001096 /LENGTH=366 /DNA_ID=CAMNT_0043425375 /DNA_START=127 /DNA_END=1227 /DNA_ORIENTATION=-